MGLIYCQLKWIWMVRHRKTLKHPSPPPSQPFLSQAQLYCFTPNSSTSYSTMDSTQGGGLGMELRLVQTSSSLPLLPLHTFPCSSVSHHRLQSFRKKKKKISSPAWSLCGPMEPIGFFMKYQSAPP